MTQLFDYREVMRCRLKKDFAAVDDLFTFIEQFVAAEGIDEDTAFQATVAAEELFTNLVKYGAPHSPEIALCMERHGEWLVLELTDFDAQPFDITTAALPNLDVPIEQRRPGGMGLHLVRSFADDLSFRHEHGNSIITFKKKIGLHNVQHPR